MLAPTELALHRVADLEVRMAALDDHAGAAPDHRVADFEGIGILTVSPAHLSAHLGIDRQEVRVRQHLALGGPRYGHVHEAEAARIGMPSGART